MRRIPVLPTLLVAAAVAVMIGLGLWQLQRAEWKEALIAKMEASSEPRTVRFTCAMIGRPEVRAGRSAAGESGYRYLMPCSARETDGDMVEVVEGTIDIGWSRRPDLLPELNLTGTFTGTVAAGQAASRQIIVLNEPIPPLEKSGLPKAADLPNNHRLYAFQWFFFAAAAAVIYILALRRRQRREA